MNRASLFFLLLITFLLSCNSTDDGTNSEDPDNSVTILKPKGLFTSSFGNETVLDHAQVNGALIRVKWNDLEPSAGVYDFTKIEQFRELIKAKNLKWSLGVIAGSSSPEWLTTTIGADYFEITTSDATINKIPKIWDAIVNERLALLAEALANSYSEDTDLVLVYIPQMTANGIEGHFNGVPKEELLTAGLTAENWISSVTKTAKIFAAAFLDKPIAVEVHDIMGDTSIPNQIMTDLWNDPSLDQGLGAAMWWISGKTTYQPNLIHALINFPGDIYAQAIGRSDQTERFEYDDYTTVFEQAKVIGIRYIELWEYEFSMDTFPQEFLSFNSYTATNFE